MDRKKKETLKQKKNGTRKKDEIRGEREKTTIFFMLVL